MVTHIPGILYQLPAGESEQMERYAVASSLMILRKLSRHHAKLEYSVALILRISQIVL